MALEDEEALVPAGGGEAICTHNGVYGACTVYETIDSFYYIHPFLSERPLPKGSGLLLFQ